MVIDERVTTPLSYEERRGLRRLLSDAVLTAEGEPHVARGPRLQDTHEAWVDEVDRAIREYDQLMAGRHARAVKARLAALAPAA